MRTIDRNNIFARYYKIYSVQKIAVSWIWWHDFCDVCVGIVLWLIELFNSGDCTAQITSGLLFWSGLIFGLRPVSVYPITIKHLLESGWFFF